MTNLEKVKEVIFAVKTVELEDYVAEDCIVEQQGDDFVVYTKFDAIEGGDEVLRVNFYKFAFEIKAWAQNVHNIVIESYVSFDDDGYAIITTVNGTKPIVADTEVEAIIKAGVWVLKHI